MHASSPRPAMLTTAWARSLTAAAALVLAAALLAGSPVAATSQQGTAGCDETVRDGDSIQDAIDEADSGDALCVRDGTYEEDLSADVPDLTIRGHAPAHSDSAAVIDGSVSLEADGVELHRVAVTRSADIGSSGVDPFGVLVKASDTVVADTVVRSLTGATDQWDSVNGIQVFGGDGITNVAVRDNAVTGFDNAAEGGVAGIKLQADVEGVSVTGNTVTDLHAAGWAWGVVLTHSTSHEGVPQDVVVEGNTMEGLNDGTVYAWTDESENRAGTPFPGSAFGVDGEAEADEVASLQGNNLLAPNGAESKDEGATLDATCNWWGDESGPVHEENPDGEGTWALERGDADIDFEPWLTATAPSRACGGGQ